VVAGREPARLVGTARHRRLLVTGGKHIIVEDASGNPVDLFEPTRPEAHLSSTWLDLNRSEQVGGSVTS
jgi:hypothetical protein